MGSNGLSCSYIYIDLYIDIYIYLFLNPLLYISESSFLNPHFEASAGAACLGELYLCSDTSQCRFIHDITATSQVLQGNSRATSKLLRSSICRTATLGGTQSEQQQSPPRQKWPLGLGGIGPTKTKVASRPGGDRSHQYKIGLSAWGG